MTPWLSGLGGELEEIWRQYGEKRARARIVADGVEGFFGRVRAHARKLDRGEELAAEVTISFGNPADVLRVSVERAPATPETGAKEANGCGRPGDQPKTKFTGRQP
jgi:hypothetical protein